MFGSLQHHLKRSGNARSEKGWRWRTRYHVRFALPTHYTEATWFWNLSKNERECYSSMGCYCIEYRRDIPFICIVNDLKTLVCILSICALIVLSTKRVLSNSVNYSTIQQVCAIRPNLSCIYHYSLTNQ